MSPRTRQTLLVSAFLVALTAIAGIAVIQGWVASPLPGEGPAIATAPATRIAATAPPESLSPGESVVSEDASSPVIPAVRGAGSGPGSNPPAVPGASSGPGSSPPGAPKSTAPATPAPVTKPESARSPVPKTPSYAHAPARPPAYAQAAPARPAARRDPLGGLCANCGTIAAITFQEDAAPFDNAWEVRVRFDDGTRRVLRYPSDPGFRIGDRVFLSNGRLRRG